MRNILITLTSAVIFITGCSKDERSSLENPLVKTSIGIVNAASSPERLWPPIIGGKALIEFNSIKGESFTATNIKDSIELNHLSTYSHLLAKGTYDVLLRAENTAVADTFIRFNAEKKSVLIQHEAKILLDANTADGLVTINKLYVEDETVPIFTASGSSESYKMGFSNGFYYLYVKGGTTGKVGFTEMGTSSLNAVEVRVETSEHYNLILLEQMINPLNFKYILKKAF